MSVRARKFVLGTQQNCGGDGDRERSCSRGENGE
jgi:hypothetical protein